MQVQVAFACPQLVCYVDRFHACSDSALLWLEGWPYLDSFHKGWHTISSAKERNKGATEALFLIIWRISGHLIQKLHSWKVKTHIKNAWIFYYNPEIGKPFFVCRKNLVLLTILSSIWLYVHSKSKSKSAGSVTLRPNQRAQNRGSRCARIHPHKSQII